MKIDNGAFSVIVAAALIIGLVAGSVAGLWMASNEIDTAHNLARALGWMN